jgi:hypothetical protein
MVRNLKILGLELMAVVALGTVSASAASATEGKITSDGPVTLKGTEIGTGHNKFEVFGTTVECPGSTYVGSKYNTTPHELIVAGAISVTSIPLFVNCQEGSNRLTIDLNECDWTYHGIVRSIIYAFLSDIICPPGNSIEITGGFCTVKIGAQVNKEGFDLTNTGSGTSSDLDLTGALTTLHATACGGLLSTNEAKMTSDVTFKGFNSAGVETGVTVSG